MTLPFLLLMLVTLQRLAEVVIARSNTQRLLGQGAIEVAPDHYPALVVLHVAWLAGLWYCVAEHPPGSVHMVPLGLYAVLQVLRVWVLATLGARWTTRIIVVPGERLVDHGPYRYLSHPNYWIVVGEILTLPLVFGLVWYAAIFSLLNFILIRVRIKEENKALGR